MAKQSPVRQKITATHKPKAVSPKAAGALALEARATITGRPDFMADDILLGSGRRTISLAASVAQFGAYEYRVINVTLDLAIQSGEYTFRANEPGMVLAMSYVEFAVVGGNEIYFNCEGVSGTLSIDIEGSHITLNAFSFTALDSEGKELSITGMLDVSSTLCDCA